MTTKKLKSIDIINVLSDLVSEKMETTVKLPTLEVEDSVVSYTVDDDGTDYIIDCEITTKSYHYTMQAKINMDSLDMHACTYGH